MEEVETAAADTTSDSSSPPLHTFPSFGRGDTFEPRAKRQKMEAEPKASGFGLHSLEKTGKNKGSIRHYSGRVIPVGIAQPIRVEEKLEETTAESRETMKESAAFRGRESSSKTRGYKNKYVTRALLGGDDNRDSCDSDQSQNTPRFNKFANESTASNRRGLLEQENLSDSDLDEKTTGKQQSDSSDSSNSDSDSSSNFDYPFAPPSLEEDDGMEQGHHGMEYEHPSGGGQEVLHARDHESGKRTMEHSSRAAELEKKVSSASLNLNPPSDSPTLPPDKKWHVFLSHSTGDKKWAREDIIVPLRDPPHNLQVAASYHFMPDSSRYNDRAIHSSIRESCVVMIGLSPAYVSSQRCNKEWQLAVQLAREQRQCQVVVAAVDVCSRPEPLKSFLYLDFIDRNKHSNVWGMLLQAINATVHRMLTSPVYRDTGPEEEGHGNKEEEGWKGEGEGEEDTSHQRQGSSSSHSPPTDTEDNTYMGFDERYQQRMAAEFEAEFEAEFQQDGDSEFMSQHPERSREVKPTPSDPRLIDISATEGLVSQAEEGEHSDVEEHTSGGEEGEGKGVKSHKGHKAEEIEEGEVSDSSSSAESASEGDQGTNQSRMVATFYNRLAEPDADRRNESPIFYMRNFNNWVKSVLIRSFLSLLPPGATVLDLCCGKGGDLLKWKEGDIQYIICADISDTSVEACKGRYRSPKMIDRATGEPPFEAEFIVADCCEIRLRDVYSNAARRFHLSSVQFSLHYAFETYEKAHMMLRNACENLRPGGYFIGTTIDSNETIHRLREAGHGEDGVWSIGNEVFSITLDSQLNPWEKLPLFGAKYYFRLHGVVNLPEFLVHFPLLVSMLRDFDMELVLQQNFYNFFMERRHNPEDAHLLFRMQAFSKQTGTMSTAEWEAIGLYLVYVFQKKKDPATA